jgi:hypothetical protein
MNPANLQLEGLYLALASLLEAMRDNDLLSAKQIDTALARAEELALNDPERREDLSRAGLEGVCFPIRLLRVANRLPADALPNFCDLARIVGQTKDLPAIDDEIWGGLPPQQQP